MKAVFDTNIIIDLLEGHPPALSEAGLYVEAAISRITWMEVLIGAPDAAHQQQWEAFLSQFVLVEPNEIVCREAIKLRQQHRIKLPDAIVLATAHFYGAQLVTRNSRDFKPGALGVRIPYVR